MHLIFWNLNFEKGKAFQTKKCYKIIWIIYKTITKQIRYRNKEASCFGMAWYFDLQGKIIGKKVVSVNFFLWHFLAFFVALFTKIPFSRGFCIYGGISLAGNGGNVRSSSILRISEKKKKSLKCWGWKEKTTMQCKINLG